LAAWPRKANRISDPPQWIWHEYSVHNAKKLKKAPFHYRILTFKKTRRLPRSQLSEANPYQRLSTPGFLSPPCKKAMSPGSCDTRSQSSFGPGVPHSRIGISRHLFQGRFIEPSADTTSP
jgi:hypothetical protein